MSSSSLLPSKLPSPPIIPIPQSPKTLNPNNLKNNNNQTQRQLPNSPPRSPRRDLLSSSESYSSNGSGASTSNSGSSSRNSVSGGVQSRRSGVSMGLGVSFAPFPPEGHHHHVNSSISGDISPLSPGSIHPLLNSTMISRPASRSVSRSVSRSHSRRSSIGFPSSTSSPHSELDHNHPPPPYTQNNIINNTTTTTSTSSNRPSRRPSLSHLASFLSGIEHHTRVRNPGIIGGRGVSRSASRSHSRVGESRRGTRDSSVDTFGGEDGIETLNGSGSGGAGAWSGGRSRASSIAPQSRRSSINGIPLGYGYPTNSGSTTSNSGNTTNSGSNIDGLAMERSVGSLYEYSEERRNTGTVMEEELDLGFRTPISTPSFAQQQNQQHLPPRIFHPPSTPRIYSTETDEEPYLETAPSSPNPQYRTTTRPPQFPPSPHHHQRTQSHDSFSNGLEDVDVFEEGDRVGVGVWLEGRGGWARDCFGEEEGEAGGNGIGGPGELEVVRRLGEGTYAM